LHHAPAADNSREPAGRDLGLKLEDVMAVAVVAAIAFRGSSVPTADRFG
jgi:hypothetical protein